MPEKFSEEDVAAQTAKLVGVVTSDPFKEIVAELAGYPEPERKQRAGEMLTVEGLRARGVDIPAGLRLTSRVFERPADGAAAPGLDVIAHTEQAPLGWCASLGQWLCISYGQ
jgi:hypothetical protein